MMLNTFYHNSDPKIYTELSREAIRNGQAAALRIWVALRTMDRTGCGIVGRKELRSFQRVYAVSDADLRYADSVSQNVFFTIHPHYIEYRSLEFVCVALKVNPGRVHSIRLADLRTISRFKAACYSAWLAGDAPKQISRAKLNELWNHGGDTLRRWERATGVAVVANVVELTPEQMGTATEPGPAWQNIPRDDRPDQEGKTYTWTDRHGRTFYQTVNSYQSFTPMAPRGMVRKVTRRLNAQRQKGADSGGATVDVQRAFYDLRKEPANYQLTPGACLMFADQILTTDKGIHSVWSYSSSRPVSRAFAFWQG